MSLQDGPWTEPISFHFTDPEGVVFTEAPTNHPPNEWRITGCAHNDMHWVVHFIETLVWIGVSPVLVLVLALVLVEDVELSPQYSSP